MANIIDLLMSKFAPNGEEVIKKKLVVSDVPASDFIPYACHYDKDTILTKNGELIQSICIESFTHDITISNLNLRDYIRNIISEKVNSNKYAVYFHTVRKKSNLDHGPAFKSEFAKNIHDKWVEKRRWNESFVNELHITIMHSPMSIKVNYKNFFFKMFFIKSLLKTHEEFLEQAASELNALTNDLTTALSGYGAVKLTLRHDENLVYYSELLSFFSHIIYLDKLESSIPISDLSRYMGKYRVKFGSNIFEIKKKNSRLFGAILSFKRHDSVSPESIDRMLQLPFQFTITQNVTFSPYKQALKLYKYQKYVSEVSGDNSFKEISGLDRYYKSNDEMDNSSASFCESQVLLMVTNESREELEDNVKTIAMEFSEVGIPIIREDLKAEHCFWSQLPGNFRYTTRKDLIPVSDIGAFASLYDFPFGSLKSVWGDYLTLFSTSIGTPYFFNFHVGNIAHTLIIGHERNDASLFNFLLSQSSKFNPKIMYLDSQKFSKEYVEKLGGKYIEVGVDEQGTLARFNPLLLPDNKESRDFLKYWFMFLLDKYSDPTDLEKYLDAASEAINVMFSLPVSERRLKNIDKFFNNKKFAEINAVILKELPEWKEGGKLSHIFDNDSDDLIELDTDVVGIDLTAIQDTPMYLSLPVLSYLLYVFKKSCKKNVPSVLAVARGNMLFNNIYFEKNLEYILDDLAKLNAAVLIQASFSSNEVNWSEAVGRIYNTKMVTKIFLRESYFYDSAVKSMFDISEDENLYLKSISSDNQFLLRQQSSSVVCNFNAHDLSEYKL